jgi:hypothetical protein
LWACLNCFHAQVFPPYVAILSIAFFVWPFHLATYLHVQPIL